MNGSSKGGPSPVRSSDEFRAIAPQRLRFLEDHGFRRAPTWEESSGAHATVVYIGRNLGFEFSWDVRDQCVDDYVFNVRRGKILRRPKPGGFSARIMEYLLTRGLCRSDWMPSDPARLAPAATLEGTLDCWGSFLTEGPGRSLLADPADFPTDPPPHPVLRDRLPD